MRDLFKILIGIALIIVFLVGSYVVFIYYFTKEPEPIAEYTFPKMNYDELEKRINKEAKVDTIFNTRYTALGKDSIRFFFITNFDSEYKYKVNAKKYGSPWLLLIDISDSKSKSLRISYKNREDYSNELKLFEEGFINKLNRK